MNAPFAHIRIQVRAARLAEPDECARLEAFVAEQGGSVFHRPQWLAAVEQGTGQVAHGILAERAGELTGFLPLTEVHSPVFGRALVSSGFAVEGGILALDEASHAGLARAAEELAIRLSCEEVELRGGEAPAGWRVQDQAHCGFVRDLAADDDAELLGIPRKARAEVRKGLKNDLKVSVGVSERDRSDHYRVYAESVRNLGTPVFPRSLFDAVLDTLDADILTLRHDGAPVASVLSLYHDGAVLPYWGGGTAGARPLRANDRMYFELMRHARRRGMTRFDFGRSKTGSGPWHYKKNWGFEPQPLAYAKWTAPGCKPRDVDPTSDGNSAKIAAWQRLPLSVANRIGPFIARSLG
ncbi:FemAB family PEP-CTERM system-associated protein [Alteriqipengyuania flavescens]|uniref:FemAB family XrtA/PEP-CTERM system-associated protein n=1 Tax=Alteriqipengyuania flavescens TaxID=3053610 RepID=UPI0025B5D2A2|nr:FemAB family XrtA/PEP-CTERM system-associated protein [Alteriqipengyuania flavescens]WJY18463.1 FemAB family PEP-CTERM system-associated protein [Alteriqipengyuania flavescens]WJY24404.1 FemAB family PEP-CTERM system-associated protein [Alteriqipengyuania flavescens]